MLNNVPISEDEEDVSYDVESLFTSIPLNDTIDFICEKIYVHKKLQPICKKSIFKKLLYKLTTECTFSATGKLRKQVDGVSMGGTLSVTLSECFMNKMERDIVLPLKPKFYRRFVDDTYRRRKKNEPDELFSKMNSYHPNIKLTIEINPSKFLDTKITRNKNEIKCFSHHKDNKLPFHWKSAVPRNYKKNVIVGDLHRANKISSDLEKEISIIKAKYLKAGYPNEFIDSIINDFHQTKEDFLIPPSLFEERKEISFQVPFCKRNEDKMKRIICKLEEYTNYKIKFRYSWKTRKLQSLFPLKDPIVHKANVIYKGTCTCKEFYIGETKRNSEVRWNEHCSLKKNSEVGDHLLVNHDHNITCQIIAKAPAQTFKRKILEAFYIRKLKPTLNSQKDIKITHLFRNGIT